MDTKTKILEKSLEKFNQDGVDNTSIRSIAKDLGMSHGNLRYHFSSKEAIIIELFNRLLKEMDAIVTIYFKHNNNMQALLETTRYSATIFLKYRFIMNDLIGICRQYEEIKKKLKTNYNNRKKQLQLIINLMVQENYFKPAPIPNYYQKFIENGMLVNDFWIPMSDMFYDIDEEQMVERYFQSWMIYLLPCLTEKGIKEVRQFVNFD